MKKLLVMCGIPGSGKSTWIKNHIRSLDSVAVVSRDAVRLSMITDKDEYFSKEKQVFAEFIRLIKSHLEGDEVETVVADATHISVASRKKLLASLGSSLKGVSVEAVVFKVSLATALERNSHREGLANVPETAIRNMYNGFRLPTLTEGFDKIYAYGENGCVEQILEAV